MDLIGGKGPLVELQGDRVSVAEGRCPEIDRIAFDGAMHDRAMAVIDIVTAGQNSDHPIRLQRRGNIDVAYYAARDIGTDKRGIALAWFVDIVRIGAGAAKIPVILLAQNGFADPPSAGARNGCYAFAVDGASPV
jgi:hypothetical protein